MKKPIINKIDYTMGSKYGSPVRLQKVLKEIDGHSIEKLTEKHGSPLFVFSEKKIEDIYKKYETAFKSRYEKVQFWWSYKTNYLNAICEVFHKLGSKAEVVSEYEYQKARNLGIEGKDIIFNGPYKPYEDLKIAVKEGAKIHIDHWDEINDLEKIAKELNIKIPVAIRCNMDTGIYPQWSRFGFNIDNGEAYDAIKRINEKGLLYLNGLHSHIGTFMLSANAYYEGTKKLILLKNRIEQEFGYKIEYIDLGGGFASKNRLKGVYQSPDVIVPTPDDYAENITKAIFEYNQGELPYLYLETGRALIDEAGYLITSIWSNKRLADGKLSYILDAGVNLLYTTTWYNFEIFLTQEHKDELNEPSMLNGPLCMNIDIINENIMLPSLKRNEKLVIYPAGAYSVTQWMQFIRYRPSVVLIKNNGEVKRIRETEKLEDIIKPENNY